MVERRNEQWHMSKSVPISLIFAIAIQTIALVWYLSNLDATVAHNVERLTRHDTRLSQVETATQDQQVALARIDENIKAIRSAVERMLRDHQ